MYFTTQTLFFFLALKDIVHPKLKVHPFATQHFVDVGSGDIGLAFHPIVDTLEAYIGRVLKHPKTTEKKHVSILLRRLM